MIASLIRGGVPDPARVSLIAPNCPRLSLSLGERLLRAIAYSPPALGPHVDLSRLQQDCATWLETGHVGSERFYAFLQATVGVDAERHVAATPGMRDTTETAATGDEDIK